MAKKQWKFAKFMWKSVTAPDGPPNSYEIIRRIVAPNIELTPKGILQSYLRLLVPYRYISPSCRLHEFDSLLSGATQSKFIPHCNKKQTIKSGVLASGIGHKQTKNSLASLQKQYFAESSI